MKIKTTMKNCPVCVNEMVAQEVLLKKANTSNVIKDNTTEIKKVDLTFYKCKVCGHGAIDNVLDDEYYEDFAVALVGIEKENHSLENIRSNQFIAIIEKMVTYGDEHGKILEIGSGGGYLLKTALNYYKDGLGIEPSKLEAETSRQLGLNVINDYFSPHLNLKKEYSAFIATMVFEHIPDVREAINYAYALLIDGGVGMIQVPNAQRTDFGKVYFDVYPQHLHYFTPLSLTKLVADAGFEVLSLGESKNKNYLEIYMRKTRKMLTFAEKMQQDQVLFDRMIKEHSYVAIWGASYAARSCIYNIDRNKIRHIFDMSQIKIGNYINDFHLQIEYPEIEMVKKCDLILIMANEYSEEIVDTLRKYKYYGDIAYYDDYCSLQMLNL